MSGLTEMYQSDDTKDPSESSLPAGELLGKCDRVAVVYLAVTVEIAVCDVDLLFAPAGKVADEQCSHSSVSPGCRIPQGDTFLKIFTALNLKSFF